MIGKFHSEREHCLGDVLRYRKGIGLIFPNPDVEMDLLHFGVRDLER